MGYAMVAPYVDFDDLDLSETLREHIADAESERLGFVVQSEHGTQTISPAGFGYLVFAQASAEASPAETFAAGYQCATEIHSAANNLAGGSNATITSRAD